MKSNATHSSTSGGDSSSVTTDGRDTTLSTVELAKNMATKSTHPGVAQKSLRLVEWNTDILLRSLRDIVAQRQVEGSIHDAPDKMTSAEKNIQKPGSMVFDELADVISLPEHNTKVETVPEQKPVELEKAVIDQLREYVTCIAGLYRANKFHNFEHASHVS